jgi:glycosyltransferase involved in cell wall biosynthesis
MSAAPSRVSAPRLSALVVARNEERQLADCLAALRFADEIVVVLDRCTDGSKAIAERLADKVIEGAWEIEGQRRNTGLDACSGPWILEVDADERVPPALAAEIRAAIADAAAPAHYLIPFDNYVGKRLVRHGWGGSWGVAATTRLFSKGAKRWGEQRIHPQVTLAGEARRLETPMIHYVDASISDMLRRLDRYSSARARDMRANGSRETFGRNLRRLFTRFFKCYVGRKGYKEGYWGFLVALMAGLWPMLAWLKYKLEDE